METEASPIVIELASGLVEFMHQLDPTWKKAFYRFGLEKLQYGSNGSYVSGSNVTLIGGVENLAFFNSMNEKGARLFESLGKEFGVFLLVVDSDLKYDILFDFDRMDCWKITKMGGRTGIPEGFE